MNLFYYLSCILNKILVLITPLHNYIDGLPVQSLMEYLHIETEHSFVSVGYNISGLGYMFVVCNESIHNSPLIWDVHFVNEFIVYGECHAYCL